MTMLCIMLSVITLSVIMLSVVMLSVMAPLKATILSHRYACQKNGFVERIMDSQPEKWLCSQKNGFTVGKKDLQWEKWIHSH